MSSSLFYCFHFVLSSSASSSHRFPIFAAVLFRSFPSFFPSVSLLLLLATISLSFLSLWCIFRSSYNTTHWQLLVPGNRLLHPVTHTPCLLSSWSVPGGSVQVASASPIISPLPPMFLLMHTYMSFSTLWSAHLSLPRNCCPRVPGRPVLDSCLIRPTLSSASLRISLDLIHLALSALFMSRFPLVLGPLVPIFPLYKVPVALRSLPFQLFHFPFQLPLPKCLALQIPYSSFTSTFTFTLFPNFLFLPSLMGRTAPSGSLRPKSPSPTSAPVFDCRDSRPFPLLHPLLRPVHPLTNDQETQDLEGCSSGPPLKRLA